MPFTIDRTKGILHKRNCLVFEKLLLSIIHPSLLTRQLYSLVNNSDANITVGIITKNEIDEIHTFIHANRDVFTQGVFGSYIKVIDDYIETKIRDGDIRLHTMSAEEIAKNIINSRAGNPISTSTAIDVGFEFLNNEGERHTFSCAKNDNFHRFVILIVYYHILYYRIKCNLIVTIKKFLGLFKFFDDLSICKDRFTDYKKIKDIYLFFKQLSPYIIVSRSEINDDQFKQISGKKTADITAQLEKNTKKIERRDRLGLAFLALTVSAGISASVASHTAVLASASSVVFPPALIVAVSAAGASASNVVIAAGAGIATIITGVSKVNILKNNNRLNKKKAESTRISELAPTPTRNSTEIEKTYYSTIVGCNEGNKDFVSEKEYMNSIVTLVNNIVLLYDELEKILITVRTYEYVLSINCARQRSDRNRNTISAIDRLIVEETNRGPTPPNPYQHLIEGLDTNCLATSIKANSEQCQAALNAVRTEFIPADAVCDPITITSKRTIKAIRDNLMHQNIDNVRTSFCGRHQPVRGQGLTRAITAGKKINTKKYKKSNNSKTRKHK